MHPCQLLVLSPEGNPTPVNQVPQGGEIVRTKTFRKTISGPSQKKIERFIGAEFRKGSTTAIRHPVMQMTASRQKAELN
jgi:hypothetical protein